MTMVCRTVLKGIESAAGAEKKYAGQPETPTVKTTSPKPPRPLLESPRAKEAMRPAFVRRQPDNIHHEPVSRSTERRGDITPVTDEKTRIVSCGQPRILPPHNIQIPLTMEIDGLKKSYSVNLAINIKELTKETY